MEGGGKPNQDDQIKNGKYIVVDDKEWIPFEEPSKEAQLDFFERVSKALSILTKDTLLENITARTFLMTSASLFSVIGIVYSVEKHAETLAEEQRLASVKASGIREVYADLECRSEDGAVLSFEEKSARVEQRMNELRKLLKIKYGMKWNEEEWEGEIEGWRIDLLRSKIKSPDLCKMILDDSAVHALTDEFVLQYGFSIQGLGLTSVPYAQLADDLALPVRKEPWTYCMNSPYQMMYGSRINEVGQFVPENVGPDKAVTLYRVSGMAREDFLVTRDKSRNCFSTSDIEDLMNYVHKPL